MKIYLIFFCLVSACISHAQKQKLPSFQNDTVIVNKTFFSASKNEKNVSMQAGNADALKLAPSLQSGKKQEEDRPKPPPQVSDAISKMREQKSASPQ